jgi:HEAT repeat protein
VRRGGLETEALRSLVRRDPADEVRAAAAEALAQRADPAAADDLVTALRDPAPDVRVAAMQGLADIGAGALPALRREIWEGDPSRPEGTPSAVLALALAGPDGVAELQRVAHEHPSEKVRRLAEIALGRLPEKH